MFPYAQLDFRPYHERMIEHHEKRRNYWLSQGNEEYASGSARKAAKWRVKAREYDRIMNGLYPQTEFDVLMQKKIQEAAKKMVAKFERQIWG
jgi:hypothetical protein